MNNNFNNKVNHQKQTRILSNNNIITSNSNNMNNGFVANSNQMNKHFNKSFNPEVDAFQPQRPLNVMNFNYNNKSNTNMNPNAQNANGNYLRAMGPDATSFNNAPRRFHIKNNNQQRYNKYDRTNNFNNANSFFNQKQVQQITKHNQ